MNANEMTCDLRMVRTQDIRIDESYQRPLDLGRVKGIAAALKVGALGAVSLSRRQDGTLYCYDGQTRLAAAIKAGLSRVPAVIVPGDQKREAEWFLMINEGRKRVHVRERHRAGVVAEDAAAIAAREMIEKYGLRISNGGVQAGQTNAIGRIQQYVKQDRSRADAAMQFLFDAWPDEQETWTSVMLRCAWEVAGKGTEFVSEVKRAIRRHRVTPRRVLDTAAGMQSATGTNGGGSAYVFRAICALCQID